MELSYIYSLLDPRTGETRYVGQSQNPELRFRGHLSEGHTEKDRWIKELKVLGLRPIMKILEEVVAYKADDAELKWIHEWTTRGANLTNSKTDIGRAKRKNAPQVPWISIGESDAIWAVDPRGSLHLLSWEKPELKDDTCYIAFDLKNIGVFEGIFSIEKRAYGNFVFYRAVVKKQTRVLELV